MRAKLFLTPIAAAGLALAALPAAAQGFVTMSPKAPLLAPPPGSQNLGIIRPFLHPHPPFFRHPGASVVVFPDFSAAPAPAAPTTIIVNAAPPPAPAPRPEKKATVETTPQGVVVVRGPGTRP